MKEILDYIFLKFKENICKDYSEVISNYKLRIDKLELSIQEKDQEIEELRNLLTDNIIADEKKEYWNNKYPKKEVLYCGRTLTNTNKMIDVPVQVFLTIKDPIIIKDLEKNNLMLKENNNQLNEHMLNIYKFTRKNYKYISDIKQFNIPELWMFPYELRKLNGGDCDDYAVQLSTYLISSGVPNWRVRCVAGDAWNGEGHLTVYVLSDDMQTWIHLNSTGNTNIVNNTKNILDLPSTNDKTDLLGIKTVWFSFNDEFAWRKFEGTIKNKNPNIIIK